MYTICQTHFVLPLHYFEKVFAVLSYRSCVLTSWEIISVSRAVSLWYR